MSDEASFLRAIQAQPADPAVKLVYADWLDERGEREKAEYVRAVTEGRNTTVTVPEPWLLIFNRGVLVWDEVTMFALGRLEGLLAAFAMCSDHSANISYDFHAQLAPLSAGIQQLAEQHYGPDCWPLRLERLDDWTTELRSVLQANLLMELGQVRSAVSQLALQVDYGREGIVNTAMNHVCGVITPNAGWRVHITENRWYAIEWTDLILEAADRVLFLHFSFSD